MRALYLLEVVGYLDVVVAWLVVENMSKLEAMLIKMRLN
jgi:hypothetical protein